MLSLLLFINILPLLFSIYLSNNRYNRFMFLGMLFVTLIIFSNAIQIDKYSGYANGLLYITISNYLTFTAQVFIKLLNIPNKRLNKKPNSSSIKILIVSLTGIYVLLFFLVGGDLNNLLISWVELRWKLDNNTALRLSIYTLFFITINESFELKDRSDVRLWNKFIIFTLLFILLLIFRIKMLMIPILFLFIKNKLEKLTLTNLLAVSFFGTIGYFTIMLSRWLGDIRELTTEKFQQVAINVYEAGIEREMYHQFTSVFEYFQNNSINLYGGGYSRFFLSPLRIFIESFSIDNPMYLYHRIANGGIDYVTGSAHPSIYGDSFATFGWGGVFVAPFILLLLQFFLSFSITRKHYFVDIAISLFIILIVRGSTYYAFFYLAFILFISSIDYLKNYHVIIRKS